MKYFLPVILFFSLTAFAQVPKFHVVAFYTAKNDLAHISFVHEANKWFTNAAKQHHFSYDSTNDWNNLNAAFLKKELREFDARVQNPSLIYVSLAGSFLAGFLFTRKKKKLRLLLTAIPFMLRMKTFYKNFTHILPFIKR